MMKQILIVEDDRQLNSGLCKALAEPERKMHSSFTIAQARKQLASASIDLVLLDIGLPDGSGIALLRECKSAKPTLPIILLTANDTDIDIVEGLESGADDYITKPFSLAVLRARSFLCCHDGYSFSYRGQYTLSDYCISGDTGYVVYNGEYIHCSNANHGTGAHGLLLYHSYIGDQSGKEMFRRRELKRVSVIFALLCIKLSYLFGYGLCRLILEY